MFRISLPSTLCIHDLRLALLNYVCAKQAHKQLIVRLESHDDTALEMLLLFGISYQHLYYQSDNFKYHLQFASTLLDKKKAFICFCENDASPYDGTCENLSSEEILNTPKPFVIRMKKEDPSSDSFVIMRTDKYPTNVFASACDDMLQGVSSIIREESSLADAQKEAYIRTSIGYDEAIAYTHVPSFLYQSDEKGVKQLLDQGFMPEAIANYLLLLGNPTPKEIFTLSEAIEWFDINTISPSSALFEIEKLKAINREHILRLDDMELSKRIGYACENVGKLAKLYTQEASTTHEIKQKIDAIFAKKESMNDDKQESLQLQNAILEAPYFEAFDDFKAHLLNVTGLNEEHLFTLLCFWFRGTHNGPELALLYPLIKTYLKEIVR